MKNWNFILQNFAKLPTLSSAHNYVRQNKGATIQFVQYGRKGFAHEKFVDVFIVSNDTFEKGYRAMTRSLVEKVRKGRNEKLKIWLSQK